MVAPVYFWVCIADLGPFIAGLVKLPFSDLHRILPGLAVAVLITP
jgi:hypothetical protein